MKATPVKAWPELVGFLPALPALSDERRLVSSPKNLIELDFGLVREVSSVGFTVFILQLLRLIGEHRHAVIKHGGRDDIRCKIGKLGGFDVLANLIGALQPELLGAGISEEVESTRFWHADSLPIYHLKFDESRPRRNSVNRFIHWLSGSLKEIRSDISIEYNGILMLLKEIAKNTADHTTSDAIFGMDIENIDENMCKISFAFGDLGTGIKRHIIDNLPPSYEARRKKMGLDEAYRFALMPGYTSKPLNGINKGHGMTIIMDVASDMGMHLSIFDAWSRGLLNMVRGVSRPSHKEIRRIFSSVGHDVGFFYYGEMFVDRCTQ